MGAIDRNGYRFEIEYSVINQKGALHVYRDGQFIEEITYDFEGNQPSPDKIEALIDQYVEQ